MRFCSSELLADFLWEPLTGWPACEVRGDGGPHRACSALGVSAVTRRLQSTTSRSVLSRALKPGNLRFPLKPGDLASPFLSPTWTSGCSTNGRKAWVAGVGGGCQSKFFRRRSEGRTTIGRSWAAERSHDGWRGPRPLHPARSFAGSGLTRPCQRAEDRECSSRL
jgi:hypothetical protein